MTLGVALVLVTAALYVRPLIFGTGPSVVGAAPAVGSDIFTFGNAAPLAGGKRTNTSGIWPPAPEDAATEPLGTPGPKPSSSTDFSFMGTVAGADGRPIAWDPCRPIHVVINNAQAPKGADRLLREAIDSVSSATGLQFVIEGQTTETPDERRAPVDEARYGNRWSPVLVAWTDPFAAPRLQGDVAGFAGPIGAPYYTAAQQHWVSGMVALDGPQIRDLMQGSDGWADARAIVMHEFGHLVGLDHVPAADHLMHEQNTGQRAFRRGDLEGLRQLGLGPCFTD
ncbi:matrixin family metalloprotease [Kribbia dieselivorans]|uniref:matrixin family metalloprotease n=1 Tax=Kribbia dieselivorans TaxID=331526 RepID=UPI0008397A87|nr:matrixin family metalloprotease [Kribbia dieselivorans]